MLFIAHDLAVVEYLCDRVIAHGVRVPHPVSLCTACLCRSRAAVARDRAGHFKACIRDNILQGAL
jgi:hypothetical protein